METFFISVMFCYLFYFTLFFSYYDICTYNISISVTEYIGFIEIFLLLTGVRRVQSDSEGRDLEGASCFQNDGVAEHDVVDDEDDDDDCDCDRNGQNDDMVKAKQFVKERVVEFILNYADTSTTSSTKRK